MKMRDFWGIDQLVGLLLCKNCEHESKFFDDKPCSECNVLATNWEIKKE